MSSIERAARVVKSLKDEEWRALYGLEKASLGHGVGDTGRISRMSKIPVERAAFAVAELRRKGLLEKHGVGYGLTKQAVELMALKDYVKKDLVFALGAIIAKGKESDVYEAVNEEGELFALKFFKLGRTSFTRVRKKSFIEASEMRSWITVNYEAAKREYSALGKLEGLGEEFPKAYAHNRSTVLLERVEGVRLSGRPPLQDPVGAFRKIMEAMRTAFLKANLINADLSEYNILTDGERVWLIDWPQAVDVSHHNADTLLRHDAEAVARFFQKAYSGTTTLESAYRYASGASSRLE